VRICCAGSRLAFARVRDTGAIVTESYPLPLRVRVVTLCSLVAFLDGFDTQSIGPAGSAIAAQIGIKLSDLGLVFSASQLGFLAGALTFGALGDRFGRKRMLIIATGIFAVCTLGTAGVGTYGALLAWRLLTGFGLGGATPNFISLASEFSLPSQRSRVVTIMWAAVPFGGMAGSFTSAAVIPRFGWQTIFFIGCAAPLILVPVLMSVMPESTEIESARAGGASASGPARAAAARHSTVAELFTEGRARTTLLLWGVSFMTWMTLVVVAFWTPPLLQKAGMAARKAASVLAFNNAGGVVGTVLIGVILGWLRPQKVLITAFIISAAFIATMGACVVYFPGLAVAAVFAGFFSSAAGGALIAVAAGAYPVDARATGVGWALGLGRLGSILGPIGAGLLVAQGWQVSPIYFAMAVPALLAAGLMMLLTRELDCRRAGTERIAGSIVF
jgi:MFS transporter, AAHS family, 4-hydroxybenzoate transporter